MYTYIYVCIRVLGKFKLVFCYGREWSLLWRKRRDLFGFGGSFYGMRREVLVFVVSFLKCGDDVLFVSRVFGFEENVVLRGSGAGYCLGCTRISFFYGVVFLEFIFFEFTRFA